ncbi:hypothetical protein FOA52_001319 [Chlamydomonas sp. UWO 241]|nr:hypothetical protein FOA52_001319 [Chlamydomonas sp. UWO 241]
MQPHAPAALWVCSHGSGGASSSNSSSSTITSSSSYSTRTRNTSSGDDYGPYASFTPRRVVVTGLGLVTPLGVGVERTWARLLSGETGVRRLTEEDLPQAHRAALEQLPCRVAAPFPKADVAAAMARMGEDPRRASAFMQLSLVAADEALTHARWGAAGGGGGQGTVLNAQQRQATGVCIGNGMSATSEVAETGALVASGKLRRVSPFFIPRILPNMAAGAVSIRYGFQGPNTAPSTACATGAHAVGEAFHCVQRGDADLMVCGGSEAALGCAIGLAGFSRLKALSTGFNDNPASASRPFDAQRDGFVMGDGSGVLVLEELEHARVRGAEILAEVRGFGASGDGHHVTQPQVDGDGALLAMSRAMQGSGVALEDVVYINAHATSTPQGDEVEQRAIARLFGPHLCESLAVSSTKGATGHLLGAAGAVEAIFTVLALRDCVAPPTANLTQPSPALLRGLVGPRPLALRPGRKAALCNSFGFGGTNACVLLATPP